MRTMRKPVVFVGIFIASFSVGGSDARCCFVPSHSITSVEGISSRSKPTSIHSVHPNALGKLKRQSMTVHQMANKKKVPPSFGNLKENKEDSNEEDQSSQSNNKRGVFKRMREKISTTFGGNKKGDTIKQNNDGDDVKVGYKPNPLDGIRLRLAMAMSNLNFFQSKEEWVVACPKTRVGPGQIVPCVVNGLDIIIFASRDGQNLDAFANACPHLGSPFDLATIERKPALKGKGGAGDGCVDCIVCPVHRTAFEIESGQVRGEWCPYPPVIGGIMGYVKPKSSLVKFAVRLRGKNVEVRIATSVKNVGQGKEQAYGMKGIK